MNKCILITFLFASFIYAQMPDFQSAEIMQANGSNITVGGHASPLVEDWNGDGKKDLLIGQFSGASILLFLNSGTNSSPILTTSAKLQADGKNLTTSAG